MTRREKPKLTGLQQAELILETMRVKLMQIERDREAVKQNPELAKRPMLSDRPPTDSVN